jgi:hypothetical protein
MPAGSADVPKLAQAMPATQPSHPPTRATLVIALCLGAAIFGVVQLAERMAPSAAQLASIVLDQAGTPEARRALHAVVAREFRQNRTSAELDEVIPRLATADRAFLGEFRPDLLRRGQGSLFREQGSPLREQGEPR